MKNDLLYLSKIYNIKKITIINKAYIITTYDGEKIVLKEKNSNVDKTYNYLSSRGFYNYVPPSNNKGSLNSYKYIENSFVPYEQRCVDLAKLAALMHAKTTYFKEVDESKYEEIYETLMGNILYLTDYYSDIYDHTLFKDYLAPHEILFMDFYSKINNALNFSKDELDNWFNEISDVKTQRVALVHNNLKAEHYIKDNDEYLISFDNAKIDSPIIDLVKLFQNEYNCVNFKKVFDSYLYTYSLTDEELKLFFVIISIPSKLEFSSNYYDNTLKVYNLVNYISKVEELIGPYYSKDEEKEETDF